MSAAGRMVFVDIETTGLSPHYHEVWEVAVIERTADGDVEHVFHVRPDLTRADPAALRLCRYYERTRALDAWTEGKPGVGWQPTREVAARLARLLDDAHFVASNPTFDTSFLQRFLYVHGQAATWRYHLIDVRALALGYLHGQKHPCTETPILTASSTAIGAAIGVGPLADDVRHTALGDARWARDLYDAITTRAAA